MPAAEDGEGEYYGHSGAEQLAPLQIGTQLSLILRQRPQQHTLCDGRGQVNTLRGTALACLPQRHRTPYLLHHMTKCGLIHLEIAMQAIEGGEVRLQRLGADTITAHDVAN